MKLAIMQPYFMPYIGYWQLMNAADKFVVYDNIEYTKKGWFNRNRILLNGKDYLFTIPIKKDSDYLDVCERFIARDFNCCKFLNIFKEAYRKAPYFNVVFPVLQNIVRYEDDNLFNYIYHSISQIRDYLGITNDIVVSSSIKINHELKGKDKVMALCKELGATDYYNSIGGQSLYNKAEFEERGINLSFLKSKLVPYKQFNNDFVPGLSIVDVMMFNSIDEVHSLINEYQLI